MEQRRALVQAVASALLLLAAAPADAEVYRCVRDGRTEYLQTRPKDGRCDPVTATASPPFAAGSTASGSTVGPLDTFARDIDLRRAQEAGQRAAAEREQRNRQYACARAKGRRTVLDRYGSRIYRTDENGKQVYMTEAEYQQQRQDVAEAIRLTCD